MNRIQLHTDMPRNMTMIPNEFLDHYMAGANGEFLKIYLYLLRWAGCPGADISTASIADFFNMTESDICRALRFWESEGLLRIARNTDGGINAICLRPITAPYDHEVSSHAEATVSVDKPDTLSSEILAQDTEAVQVPAYPIEDLQDFIEHQDGDQLFFIIQQYTGKPLSPTDMNTIFFFYRELGMSQDLIEHLFEYCISNGHRRMSYIQAVAIGWTEAGIHTVEAAKTYCASFNQLNTAVINAFGIKNRYLSEDELTYVRRWSREYHFSQDLIVEACRRTILTAHSASFKYANSILERWKNNQVQNMSDVRRLDDAFEKAKALRSTKEKEQEARPSKPPASKKPASRFHNFNQRTYDYGEMEVEFVKKLHARTQQ